MSHFACYYLLSVGAKVREHPTKGPFVEGAITATVETARDMERLLVEGQARRAVAGTNMNEASSRSHAIFTILATKAELDLETGAEGFTTSKVSFTDAGIVLFKVAPPAWEEFSIRWARSRRVGLLESDLAEGCAARLFPRNSC